MDRDARELTRCTRIIGRHQSPGSALFLNADQIRDAVGEVQAARALPSDALLMTTLTTNLAEKLLRLDRFMEDRVLCEPADHQPTVEAVAHAPCLVSVSEEELISEHRSQGVVDVRTLKMRTSKPNPRLCFSFLGTTAPSSIRRASRTSS